MRFITVLCALFVSSQAKKMLLITNYETPILMDMVGIKETGPFVSNLYTTTCNLIGGFNSNVTHFNPSVGWIIETDLGNGYYDVTYFNKAENSYGGEERTYSDASFRTPTKIIEIDMCENVQ
ncbi:hypothetical protein AYI69_g5460 [Smittium culicis]|uniref:Uncharacterized protein n=1 Tax=Smittium culicis TaxID=133412 RepID=A0A1R1WYP2_9FUNG|nr:hypothetical protein AYI69_g11443 [Smittium culicis]OMJ09047.1 hypothetical protein AYI69_g10840 [Smittium culicis]OMJ22262.1 hypothetical protein AYI69_g5460 [Smittium culicis]